MTERSVRLIEGKRPPSTLLAGVEGVGQGEATAATTAASLSQDTHKRPKIRQAVAHPASRQRHGCVRR
jgi:hypothetical protein